MPDNSLGCKKQYTHQCAESCDHELEGDTSQTDQPSDEHVYEDTRSPAKRGASDPEIERTSTFAQAINVLDPNWNYAHIFDVKTPINVLDPNRNSANL